MSFRTRLVLLALLALVILPALAAAQTVTYSGCCAAECFSCGKPQ